MKLPKSKLLPLQLTPEGSYQNESYSLYNLVQTKLTKEKVTPLTTYS